MSTEYRYEPIRGDGQIDAAARALCMAFGVADPAGSREWMQKGGLENVRVLTRGDEPPPACLMLVPMGQFFGGSSVPMTGIAGVAVAPEARGGGLALRLMSDCIRDLAARGVPLSCLYASTQALYRQAGYEQAGHEAHVHIPLSTIGVRERGLRVAALTDADEPAVRACYPRFASQFNGMLDRGPYIWNRTRKMRDEAFTGLGVFEPDGALAGYMFITHRRHANKRGMDIGLSDLAYVTPQTGRRLLGLLADHATTAAEAQFVGGPGHPILALMPLQKFRIDGREFWMLRICDVKRALEARGYPRNVSARIGFDVSDAIVPQNAGRWTLTVEGGQARAEKHADGARATTAGAIGPITLDVRGLAAIYSGFLTPAQAQLAGLLNGPAEALAAAQPLFSGGPPWMTDTF